MGKHAAHPIPSNSMVGNNKDSYSQIIQHGHQAIEADAASKGDRMSTAAEERVVFISQAPSPDGPDQNESWESSKEALQDAFAAGSTTELSQSERLLNQHGNSVRLIALCGNDLRFCPPMKKWFYFTGTHWATDETGVVRTLAKDTVFRFLHQAFAAKKRRRD